uniref:PsbP C-terminal domain-containing protein n=1 Tax=Kalanchoe fedtschenkoi TaxID=63787 RepID=A0A7N0UTQ8_KALFE
MASVSSLHSISTPSRFSKPSPSLAATGGIPCLNKQSVRCCAGHDSDRAPELQAKWGSRKRREVVLHTLLTSCSIPAVLSSDAFAVTEDLKVYTDEVNKFKISIPNDWQVGAGQPNGFKSITAFYPEETSTSNVSVVITGLGPDFTRLESFGKVDEFAETLVSGLDRSWQRPPGVTAKLIDCKSSKGFYYIEYSLKNPGESKKHIYSAIGMASNGWYNRLYTVTGQFVEEESEKFGSDIQKAVASFRFT